MSNKIVETLYVEIGQLAKSPRNVRANAEPVNIPQLAAEIEACGQLLYPPVVVAATVGEGAGARTVYEVDAGERRRLALLLLVEQGKLSLTDTIVVHRIEAHDGPLVSLIENVGREPMHPADEFEAFKQLVDAGKSIEDVAALFGVMPVVVERRLRLANVSPKLVGMYRAGDGVTLEHLMALSVSRDHAAQEAAWETASTWDRHPSTLRQRLTKSEARADSLLARYVGVEAYEAAGGTVRRDLFDDAGQSYLTDSELLLRLAFEQLQAAAAAVKAEGWGWVECAVSVPYDYLGQFRRCPRTERAPTDAEQAQIDALKADQQRLEQAIDDAYSRADGEESSDEAASLQNEMDSSEQIDALEAQREQVSADLAAIQAGLCEWEPAMMLKAGAIVTLEPFGSKVDPAAVVVHRGLVRPQDAKEVGAAAVAAGLPFPASGNAKAAKPKALHSEALVRRLTAHRTVALQSLLVDNPQTALAVLAQRLAHDIFGDRYGFASPIGISSTPSRFALTAAADDLEGSKAWTHLQGERACWMERFRASRQPLLAWLLSLSGADLQSFVALGVALTLDAIQATEGNHAADEVAAVLGLDMADWWTPTAASYLQHVPKARIAEAVSEAVPPQEATPLDKMKKAEAVEKAEQLLAGRRWLPTPLRPRPVQPERDEDFPDDDNDAFDGAPDGAADHAAMGDNSTAAAAVASATLDGGEEREHADEEGDDVTARGHIVQVNVVAEGS